MKNLLLIFSILLVISCKSQKQDAKSKFSTIDAKPLENAVLAGGKLIRVDSFPSKNIVPRSVDVWLPENYSSTKKYAVLYMHDGQNLFVGIHNIPKIRWQDLYPEKAMDFLSKEDKEAIYDEAKKSNFSVDLKGDEYLQFLVKELKPYIDETYSVYTNKENTFVAGSSMGGLMSMYAVAEYPTIFAGAACFSTHWVGATPKENNKLPAAIFAYLEANLPDSKTHKMYFDYGNKTLDAFYPQYAPRVDAIFKNGGYNDTNFKNLFFEGTDHSEKSWQKRLELPFTFLLKK